MTATTTEQLHDAAVGLDLLPLEEVATLLTGAQTAAAKAPGHATPALCSGARAMAATLRKGGCLYYVAAGSSGLMAAADAMELGGTYGIPSSQIRILMAGGLPTSAEMPGDTEDASATLPRDLADLSARDCVLAVAASGSTPYTVKAVEIARSTGAVVIGIANNPGTPLLRLADHPVLLQTAPELVSGSTRMGAGTAQKIALNTLSTLMAAELGHIHDGMMVNLRADNAKLRQRAHGIVTTIAGVDEATARTALAATNGAVKPAILIAAGAKTPEAAQHLLDSSQGHLRPALRHLKSITTT